MPDGMYDFDDVPGIGDLGITGFGMAMHAGEELALQYEHELSTRLGSDASFEEDLILDSMSEIDLEHMLDEAPVEMISILTKEEAGKDAFFAAVKEDLGVPGGGDKEIKLGQTWQDIF